MVNLWFAVLEVVVFRGVLFGVFSFGGFNSVVYGFLLVGRACSWVGFA